MKRSFIQCVILLATGVLACAPSACRTQPSAAGWVAGASIGTAHRRMLTPFSAEVIDSHSQIYPMSCIPSSVEMVLKLLGRVPEDYYGLQEAWQNKSDGNFRDFDGKTIAGVTFHQRFSLPRNRGFPIQQLFDAISAELEAGRYVIVGLASGNGWHNWVIYDQGMDGEFIAVTKIGTGTVESRRVKRLITLMKGTDIGVYEMASVH